MKADLSFVHRLFVCGVLCAECGFLCADFWCGFFGADFLLRIFRCGFFGADFLVRIFRCGFFGADFCADCFAIFFARRPQGELQKKSSKKSIKKSSPKSCRKFAPKSPQNSPQIPLRTFASLSSLGLKGGAGAHLDALVEVGCQSRRLSGNRWQGLTQG